MKPLTSSSQKDWRFLKPSLTTRQPSLAGEVPVELPPLEEETVEQTDPLRERVIGRSNLKAERVVCGDTPKRLALFTGFGLAIG